jgi:hypothetical protein
MVEFWRSLEAAESKADDQEDKLNCTICMDNERRVMYRPCNHFIACGQCPSTPPAARSALPPSTEALSSLRTVEVGY